MVELNKTVVQSAENTGLNSTDTDPQYFVDISSSTLDANAGILPSVEIHVPIAGSTLLLRGTYEGKVGVHQYSVPNADGVSVTHTELQHRFRLTDSLSGADKTSLIGLITHNYATGTDKYHTYTENSVVSYDSYNVQTTKTFHIYDMVPIDTPVLSKISNLHSLHMKSAGITETETNVALRTLRSGELIRIGSLSLFVDADKTEGDTVEPYFRIPIEPDDLADACTAFGKEFRNVILPYDVKDEDVLATAGGNSIVASADKNAGDPVQVHVSGADQTINITVAILNQLRVTYRETVDFPKNNLTGKDGTGYVIDSNKNLTQNSGVLTGDDFLAAMDNLQFDPHSLAYMTYPLPVTTSTVIQTSDGLEYTPDIDAARGTPFRLKKDGKIINDLTYVVSKINIIREHVIVIPYAPVLKDGEINLTDGTTVYALQDAKAGQGFQISTVKGGTPLFGTQLEEAVGKIKPIEIANANAFAWTFPMISDDTIPLRNGVAAKSGTSYKVSDNEGSPLGGDGLNTELNSLFRFWFTSTTAAVMEKTSSPPQGINENVLSTADFDTKSAWYSMDRFEYKSSIMTMRQVYHIDHIVHEVDRRFAVSDTEQSGKLFCLFTGNDTSYTVNNDGAPATLSDAEYIVEAREASRPNPAFHNYEILEYGNEAQFLESKVVQRNRRRVIEQKYTTRSNKKDLNGVPASLYFQRIPDVEPQSAPLGSEIDLTHVSLPFEVSNGPITVGSDTYVLQNVKGIDKPFQIKKDGEILTNTKLLDAVKVLRGSVANQSTIRFPFRVGKGAILKGDSTSYKTSSQGFEVVIQNNSDLDSC